MIKLLEDTRQKAEKHAGKHAWFERNGICFLRSKIAFGDYCLPPPAAVDTKASIYELAADIDTEHQRFKNEMILARDYGCELFILVENTDGVHDLKDLAEWTEDYAHYSMRLSKNIKARRITGSRLAKACKTLSDRYGATFLFCSPEESGELIVRLLGGVGWQRETI